jgi:hypothetical protein
MELRGLELERLVFLWLRLRLFRFRRLRLFFRRRGLGLLGRGGRDLAAEPLGASEHALEQRHRLCGVAAQVDAAAARIWPSWPVSEASPASLPAVACGTSLSSVAKRAWAAAAEPSFQTRMAAS